VPKIAGADADKGRHGWFAAGRRGIRRPCRGKVERCGRGKKHGGRSEFSDETFLHIVVCCCVVVETRRQFASDLKAGNERIETAQAFCSFERNLV